MPGGVEAVRALEVRLLEAELGGLRVHQADEAADAASGMTGERVGGVVRALDERGGEEVAHAQALAAAKLDARLPDRRRERPDRHRLARTRLLERHDRRHQLRDARDRVALVRVPLVEHLAGRPVRDDDGLALDRGDVGGRGGAGRDGRDDGDDDGGHAPAHGRQGYPPTLGS